MLLLSGGAHRFIDRKKFLRRNIQGEKKVSSFTPLTKFYRLLRRKTKVGQETVSKRQII